MNPQYIEEHPILGLRQERKPVTFTFNGQAVIAQEGDMVAFALSACGVKVFSRTHKSREPRGLFCAIGHCTDCRMRIDGVENVRACVTCVKEGMRVESGGKSG